jgi:hypothetical protein
MEKEGLSSAAVVKIVLIALLCLLLMGGVTGLSYCGSPVLRFWGWGVDNGWRYGSAADYNVGSGKAPVPASASNLVVDWTFGTLRIVPYSGSDIQVTEAITGAHSRKDQVLWLCEGDTFYVRAADPGFSGCSALTGRKEVEVKIPRSMAENLREVLLNITSGDVLASGLECAELNVSVTSGRAALDDSVAQTASIKVSSGSLKTDGLKADALYLELTSGALDIGCSSGEIHLDTASGEANVKDAIAPGILDVSTTSGSVTVSIPENPGFKATVDKTSGNFDCGFPVTQSDNSYTYKNGKAQYRFEMTSGNVRLLLSASG